MIAYFREYWPGLLILTFSLFIGFMVYQDYGMSMDEDSQRMTAFAAYDYAKGTNPDYLNWELKDHGPGFEWVLMGVEKTLNITKFRDIYLTRHLVTYLFFIFCMFSGYVLVYKIFNNKLLASLALVALIFHPRLFAHGFFNPKDIPAMSAFMLSLAAARWAFVKQKWWPFFLLGLICGFGSSIRLMNMVIAAPVGIFLLLDLIRSVKEGKNILPTIGNMAALFSGFCLLLYTSWPALWIDPVASFIEVYESLSNFKWIDYVWFQGSKILSTNLPWDYIPTWFFITTPEVWILLGLAGMILLVANYIFTPKPFLDNTPERNVVLAFICFFLSIITVIKLDAVLYDGWRHMYFIYPCFVVLMAYGINELTKYRSKKIIWAICLLQLIYLGRFFIMAHPFQHVYFNHFISHEDQYLRRHYEMDYWGTSTKDALEWLTQNTGKEKIWVNLDHWEASVRLNTQFISKDLSERFETTPNLDEMDYRIEFFRVDSFRYPNKERPDLQVVREIEVLNSPIYRIVKMR